MLRRKENKRGKVSQRMLVLCEGKTEKIYLEGLKSTLPKNVQRDIQTTIIQAKKSDPNAFFREFKELQRKAKREWQPYAESWMVFDDDNRDLELLIEFLVKNGDNYVYNSISIEFWFLLHKKYTTKQFTNAHSVIQELKNIYGYYLKTDPNLWLFFSSEYETAKAHALKLRTQHINDSKPTHECKPYSNMDVLVERIKKMKK
ncbi:MAG: RloB domain-containing protein [Bacteroidales bacterium]|nr:RloB domain-containing protein [Bacteroidales bacterium]